MKIVIETVPHSKQRYDTVGDYVAITPIDFGREYRELHIKVSDLGDWRLEALVAIHELIEAVLCLDIGTDFKEIDEWDTAYKEEGEPGDDPASPYYHQHQFASRIEWLMAYAMNVDWLEYEKAVREVS